MIFNYLTPGYIITLYLFTKWKTITVKGRYVDELPIMWGISNIEDRGKYTKLSEIALQYSN